MAEPEQEVTFIDGGPDLGPVARERDSNLVVPDPVTLPLDGRDLQGVPSAEQRQRVYDLDREKLEALNRYVSPAARQSLNERLQAVVAGMPTHLRYTLSYDAQTPDPVAIEQDTVADTPPADKSDILACATWWLGKGPVLDEAILDMFDVADATHQPLGGEEVRPLQDAFESIVTPRTMPDGTTDYLFTAMGMVHDPYFRLSFMGNPAVRDYIAGEMDNRQQDAFEFLESVFALLTDDADERMLLISRYYAAHLEGGNQSAGTEVEQQLRDVYGGVDPVVYARLRLGEIQPNAAHVMGPKASLMIRGELTALRALVLGSKESELPEHDGRTLEDLLNDAVRIGRRAVRSASLKGEEADKERRRILVDQGMGVFISTAYDHARRTRQPELAA